MSGVVFSTAELLAITGGQGLAAVPEVRITGMDFDSRRVSAGNLFIALRGETVHGHVFLDAAFQRGAALALVEDPVLLDSSPYRDRLLCVADTLKAFSDIARAWRTQIGVPVLAVTGSMGKTTVKSLSQAILSAWKKGYASEKSFNNHTGVPYSIGRISADDAWAVLEMGMNHAGELRQLSHIGAPDVALITCIAPVHIEFFQSLEEIAAAKLEIVEGLPAGGTVVLNLDDSVLMKGFSEWQAGHSNLRQRSFGLKDGADVRIVAYRSLGLEGSEVTLEIHGVRSIFTSVLPGQHNAGNIAAAVAGSLALVPELPVTTIQQGLAAFQPESGRLNVVPWQGTKKIIDDSYNANPWAVRASLSFLQELHDRGLRVGAILGDMLELGEKEELFHRDIGTFASGIKLEFVITVGTRSQWIAAEARKGTFEVLQAETPEAAADLARSRNWDVLLVKASRGIKLEQAVQALVKHP